MTPLACGACGAALAGQRFRTFPVRCSDCGRTVELAPAVAVEPRATNLGLLAATKLRRWIAALRERASGHSVIVDACACGAPLSVSAATPVELPCAHCGAPARGLAGEWIADALPHAEASIEARTWGGGVDLRWAIEHRVAEAREAAPCPRCGASIAPFVGETTCAHCRTQLLAFLSCGRRVVPGIRVRGHDEGQNVDRWMPLDEGLAHAGARVTHAVKQTGAGCGFALVFFFVAAFALLLLVAGGVLFFVLR